MRPCFASMQDEYKAVATTASAVCHDLLLFAWVNMVRFVIRMFDEEVKDYFSIRPQQQLRHRREDDYFDEVAGSAITLSISDCGTSGRCQRR